MAGISEQTCYRWRTEYGGLRLHRARGLEELEKENRRLRQRVADLSLDKTMLTEVAKGAV